MQDMLPASFANLIFSYHVEFERTRHLGQIVFAVAFYISTKKLIFIDLEVHSILSKTATVKLNSGRG
jgi:hypothetical protein